MNELTEQETKFIEALILNGGNLGAAAESAGYARNYGYALRSRLSKHIIDATKDYFAVHAIKAANRVIESIDNQMPNAVNLNAALALLDRVGISKKDLDSSETIKANVFILPAKDNEKDY
jgi:hypothetical protein